MSTCKGCLHDIVCPYSLAEVICDDFKDRSKFVELPCKVGDTVYIVGDKFPAEIEGIRITNDGEFQTADIGKIVFLTKEEAEKVIKEQGRL